MEEAKEKILKIFDLVGFESIHTEVDEAQKKISISIKDRIVSPARLPELVSSLTHLVRQIVKHEDIRISVDVNDYRKERDSLITKIARAAAKKASVTKEAVPLPVMNAYERRIVHAELSMNPNIRTESEGENKDRHVVVRPN
jgi:predicted RNA-binding protein Jag